MITDISDLNSQSYSSDVCIIGAGPAGISLANKLSINNKLSVILIESGDFEYDKTTQELYTGKIIDNLPPVALDLSRLRYFGGTSNHWGGSSGPFDDIDFKKRDWIDLSGWPISKQDIDEFYKEAHQVMGTGDYSYDPTTLANDSGVNLMKFTRSDVEHRFRKVKATRFGIEFRKRLVESKNVQVILNANVVNMDFDSNKSLNFITVQSLKNKKINISSKQYVLATGGVENARLLLSSKLADSLPLLGRCFSFHPRLQTGTIITNYTYDSDKVPYHWQSSQGKRVKYNLVLSEAVQKKEKLANYAAILNEIPLNSAGIDALRRIKHNDDKQESSLGSDIATIFGDLGNVADYFKRKASNYKISAFNVITYVDQIPNKESRVVLGDDVDQFGMRKSKILWQYFDDERDSIYRFNQILARELGHSNIGRMQISEQLKDDEEFKKLLRGNSGGGHQIGTTRMSASVTTGVVDENCKVHNVNNLYVAGSSVFPTGSWMNPTITVVALSLRLADRLTTILNKPDFK